MLNLPQNNYTNASERNELIRSKQLFLELLRNYPDGIISIIDQSYCFVYTGGSLHTFLNVDPNTVMGHKMYPRFPEQVREIIAYKLNDVFCGKNVSEYEIPYPIKGDFFIMDAFPLKDETGNVIQAGVIIRKISELKRIENELKRSLEQEKELSELKSRFISMASHEFRTPLSAISSSTYLLDKYTPSENDKARKHINQIVLSVNILTEILNDFLSVTKIDEGKIAVNSTDLNIKQALNDLITEFDNILKCGQVINYNHFGHEFSYLDPFLLRQIVTNLISNAIKFSPEDTVIEVNTQNKEDETKLIVKDSGIGIPEEDQKYLFERFHRGANATNIQGTGLGLHIVQKYIESLHGTIQCKSTINNGTEFIITFKNRNNENCVNC